MEQLTLEVTIIFESKNLKSNLTIDFLSRGNNPKTIKYKLFWVKRLDEHGIRYKYKNQCMPR